jgi:hypothetical protein
LQAVAAGRLEIGLELIQPVFAQIHYSYLVQVCQLWKPPNLIVLQV